MAVPHARENRVQLRQLHPGDGALQFRHAPAMSPPDRNIPVPVGGIRRVRRVAGIMQGVYAPVQFRIPGDNHAAFPRGNVLVDLQAEDARIAESADAVNALFAQWNPGARRPLRMGAQGLGAVLQHSHRW